MRWNKYTLKTTTEATDLISDMLMELGIEGIEVNDNIQLTEAEQKQMFIDILAELPEDNGEAFVSFYLDADMDSTECSELLKKVKEGLLEISSYADIGEASLTSEEINEDDFKDNWKEFFHPFKVSEDIVVKPTWEELPDNMKGARAILALDPGSAFGTGEHETTRLCMLNIQKYMKENDTVIDIGCGSGILSILAKKLGASKVLGTDIDENAVNVSVENTLQNSINSKRQDRVTKASDLAADTIVYSFSNVFEKEIREEINKAFEGGIDVVVANILADVIIPIAGFVKEFMKEDSVFISSGIYVNRVDAVKKAMEENGLKIVEISTMGDWSSFVCKK